MARPTDYTPKLGHQICKLLANGWTLRRIAKRKGMPAMSTILSWVLDPRHKEFSEQYARARAAQAELMFDEILEIADDGSNDLMTVQKGDETYTLENKEITNRSRLRVDSRKWYLSKVLPKKYGDKLDMTSDGKALPTPLLHVLRDNNSNNQDSQPEETH